MKSRFGLVGILSVMLAVVLAACAGSASSPTTGGGSTAATSVPSTGGGNAAPTEAATSAAASAQAVKLTVAQDPTLGQFIADANGRSLYMFTKDTKDTSNCYDQCAKNWPPLLGNGQAGDGVTASLIGSTQRKDGTTQVTYNGMPLYYWFKDQKPGDVTGQNVGQVWFVVSPAGDIIKTTSATPEATAASTAAAPASATTSASAAMPTGPATLKVAQDAKLGQFLVDDQGRSLYEYDKDTKNTSNCYDKCATAWPPLLTSGNAMAGTGLNSSLLGTTQRKDGTMQVTYNGMPLYYYVKDQKAGDVTGQNVGSVWYVVSPAGDKIVK